MASVELSRRVEKVLGFPPLSEMGADQRRELHEALLEAEASCEKNSADSRTKKNLRPERLQQAGAAVPQRRRCRDSPPHSLRRTCRQILEAVGLDQRLVELAALEVAHVGEWWVDNDLLDAAAQIGARHWRS